MMQFKPSPRKQDKAVGRDSYEYEKPQDRKTNSEMRKDLKDISEMLVQSRKDLDAAEQHLVEARKSLNKLRWWPF